MTLTGSTSIVADRGLIACADVLLSNPAASTRVGVFPAGRFERRIVFGDARQHHRRAVGEFGEQRQVPAHGLDGFRRVDSRRSLRFSRRETLSWVMPSGLAVRTWVTNTAWRHKAAATPFFSTLLYGLVQSSVFNCFTRPKTRSLVTNTAGVASAWAAIIMSRLPIGSPSRSRTARIRA